MMIFFSRIEINCSSPPLKRASRKVLNYISAKLFIFDLEINFILQLNIDAKNGRWYKSFDWLFTFRQV